jgi:hypothetical protein
MTASTQRCLAAGLVLLLLGQPVRGEKPSRKQIVKAGKAATALVLNQFRQAQGTAFCIHPSGIFLTNEHVIRQQPNLSLVLNAGTNKVKILPATVLRSDKGLDLALVRVKGQKGLPALDLAKDDNLAETDRVIAFGFPFGQVLAIDQKKFPAISVNTGKVTSLREKNGELHRIQVDVVLNPGNSGGPMLDENGKLVGVVVSGIRSSGVNFAIPVRHVTRFISRPEILFQSPALKLADLHKEVEFRARAVTFLAGAKAPDLELVLLTENQAPRKFPMKLKDGLYLVSAVPVPQSKGPAAFRLMAVFKGGSVRGEVEDQAFQVGKTKVKLSEVRHLVGGARPRVWLRTGQILRGELTGLGEVRVRLGGTSLPLDLAKATAVNLAPPAALESLTGTIVARRGGKEVARLTRFLAVQGGTPSGDDDVFVDLEVAPLAKDKAEVKLEAPVADVAVGGGGRYLILHLPKPHKLAVFDVNKAKVVKQLPTGGSDIRFTAGLDKLVVALPGTKTIQRWDLKTFKLELAAPYPLKGDILALSMGAATRGPVLVFAKETTKTAAVNSVVFLVGLKTLKRREIGWVRTQVQFFPNFFNQTLIHVRTALDGKGTGFWSTTGFPFGVNWIQWHRGVAAYSQHPGAGGYVVPMPGGKLLGTGLGMVTSLVWPNTKKLLPGTDAQGRYLPAYQGGYYLYLGTAPTFQNKNPPAAFEIHQLGVEKPLLRLADVKVPNTDEQQIKHDFTLDKRFHLIPQAKVLIVIPPSNDRLVLYRVDLDKARKKMTEGKK